MSAAISVEFRFLLNYFAFHFFPISMYSNRFMDCHH
uniref:Uncharacterized protein n=1 Tax=Anguilla anguilla TaxID=7936 RepID=A0A0E9RJ13_ANGAN